MYFFLNKVNSLTFPIFIFSSLTLGLSNERISKLVDPNKRFFVITFGQTREDTFPNFLFCLIVPTFLSVSNSFSVGFNTSDSLSFSFHILLSFFSPSLFLLIYLSFCLYLCSFLFFLSIFLFVRFFLCVFFCTNTIGYHSHISCT